MAGNRGYYIPCSSNYRCHRLNPLLHKEIEGAGSKQADYDNLNCLLVLENNLEMKLEGDL